jgi:hypothetical protein
VSEDVAALVARVAADLAGIPLGPAAPVNAVNSGAAAAANDAGGRRGWLASVCCCLGARGRVSASEALAA